MIADAPALDSLPSIQLSLRFQGESFDPDEITRRMGIEPTTSFMPGDPIAADGSGRRRRYGWRLAVEERETLELGTLLSDLQNRVGVSGTTVRQICADLGVTAVITCSVLQRGYESSPVLIFPPDFIDWVSGLGASLDVDIWT